MQLISWPGKSKFTDKPLTSILPYKPKSMHKPLLQSVIGNKLIFCSLEIREYMLSFNKGIIHTKDS